MAAQIENESKSSRKAVIRHRIFLKGLTVEEISRLEKQLTYTIWQRPQDKFPLIRKHFKKEKDRIYSIPRGRRDLIPEGFEVTTNHINNPVSLPKPKMDLRDDQAEFLDIALNNDISMLNAPPGWGKTFAALHTAYRLGQKTLVVTTNTNIRQMWVDEVHKLFGFTPDIIGSGKKNFSTPIVISNIQTLTNVYESVYKEFGTVIVDECHHCPASTFANIVANCHASYLIGLSGTLQRKDKLEVLFKDWFSDNIFSPKETNVVPCTVLLYNSPINFPESAEAWAARETMVYESELYLKELKALATGLYNQGHKILLTMNRVSGMNYLIEGFDKAIVINSYTSLEDRTAFLTSLFTHEGPALVVATQSIFAEGISCNPLDAVILGASISAEVPSLIYQLVARVRRQWPTKTHGLVVDICLRGPTVQKHRRERVKFYQDNSFNCIPVTLKDFLTNE